MKVLVYLESASARGGIEVFAERHVAAMRSEGREVDVVDERSVGSFDGYDEIVVHKCSDVDMLENFPPERTIYYVHDHEPVCPRGYAYTPLGCNCSRPGALFPCVFCASLCRSWRAALGRVFSQSRRKRAMSRFSRIVVISQFMKSRLVMNGIDPERISVEPPVIRVGADGRAAAPVAEDVDMLYVGQLIRGKGVHLLLQAMSRLARPRTLDVVGTGNMECRLRQMAEELGLGGRVRFRGFQPDPQGWMRRARCVVVPSFWQEPYGLVAAEAVALGVKVVAFDIGGLPEACGGRAVLVPAGDVAKLAEVLEEI